MHDTDRPNIEAVRQYGGEHWQWDKLDLISKMGNAMGTLYKLWMPPLDSSIWLTLELDIVLPGYTRRTLILNDVI